MTDARMEGWIDRPVLTIRHHLIPQNLLLWPPTGSSTHQLPESSGTVQGCCSPFSPLLVPSWGPISECSRNRRTSTAPKDIPSPASLSAPGAVSHCKREEDAPSPNSVTRSQLSPESRWPAPRILQRASSKQSTSHHLWLLFPWL